MSEIRFEDRNGTTPRPIDQRSAGQGNDADIVLVGYPGCSPALDTGAAFPLAVADLEMAREFGRRGDQRAFEKWLCQQTSDANTWKKLREEFKRARDEQEPIEAWRRTWRVGLVPQLTLAGLEGLLKALQEDSPGLITGSSTKPPALQAFEDLPLEGACPLCTALLDGSSLSACSVRLMDLEFARVAWNCDKLCGEPGAVRYFCNQVDSWTRPELIRHLIPEVLLAIAEKSMSHDEPAAETPLARQLRQSVAQVQKNGGLRHE
jgi:hypothetical protein